MEGRISNKIKEIVEQRRKSIDKDSNFKFTLGEKAHKDNRPTLSESIEKESGISIISEIKPASPTMGNIRKVIDVKKVAKEMEDSGVVGLSVLTEPNFFNGSYKNLKIAIENEKRAYAFYQKKYTFARGEEIKEMFEQMATEEDRHIKILSDQLEHLKINKLWKDFDELEGLD